MKGRKKHERKKTRKGIFKKKSLYGIVFAVKTTPVRMPYPVRTRVTAPTVQIYLIERCCALIFHFNY